MVLTVFHSGETSVCGPILAPASFSDTQHGVSFLPGVAVMHFLLVISLWVSLCPMDRILLVYFCGNPLIGREIKPVFFFSFLADMQPEFKIKYQWLC